MVDDALARGGAAFIRWGQNNWKVLQWVITAAIVATAAHELAHVAGYCGEADADAVGVLAGLASDDALARYATALAAFRRVCGALDESQRKPLFDALFSLEWMS